MGGKESKSKEETRMTPEPPISNVIQEPTASCSSVADDFAIIECLEVESINQPTTSQQSTKPRSQRIKAKKLFKIFIEACIADTDHSTEATLNHARTLMLDGFSKLSVNKLNACFNTLIKSLYKNIDKLRMHLNIFSIIYEDTRQTNQSVINFSTAFRRFCIKESHKITYNEKWDEIVMFGAVLCELTLIYHENLPLITEKLNSWINEIIKSALGGNENGLIAFMLILNRLIKCRIIFDEINRGYFKILRTLLGDGDYESKLQIIGSCLSIEHSITMNKNKLLEQKRLKIQKRIQLDDSEYLEEVAKSQKCKDFDKYLKSKSKGDNDCCDFFSDATNNEFEYFARKFIDFGLDNPKEIKILGSIASKYQTSLIRTRKFIKDLVKSLETEFEALKQAQMADSFEIGNLGRLIGEMYVSEKPIIPPAFMTDFLTFSMDNGDITTIASTLKLCGYFYKSNSREHFKAFMESINVFRSIVEDEIDKISENFEDKNQIYQSRLFKPAGSARQIGSLEVILPGLSENRSIAFNYELLSMLHINTKRLIKLVIKTLQKPDANVIEIAKFFKSFYDFSFKIGNFLQRLKENLKMRVLDMSVDNLQEMRNLGKFIAELKNLAVTSNDSQKLWLEKVKTLDIFENFEVMEVYVDVLKPMLVNIQVQEYEKLLKIHKYIQDINNSLEPSDSEIITRIKSKIDQILQNIVIKKIDSATSDIIFKIRHGQKVDGLPNDMPKNDAEIFDVQDFAKIFYINAISSHLFTHNHANAIKFLKSGPKGATFIQSLRDTLSANLFPNIFAAEFFESDEAPGTFDFIVHLFKEAVLTESEIISFLQIIHELENLENYKIYTSKFVNDLQSVVVRGTRRNNKKFSPNLRNCIEKVQKRLKSLDVERVEVQNTKESCEEVKDVEVEDEEAKDPEIEHWEDRYEESEFNEVKNIKGECLDDKIVDSSRVEVPLSDNLHVKSEVEALEPELSEVNNSVDDLTQDKLKTDNFETNSIQYDQKVEESSCLDFEPQHQSTVTSNLNKTDQQTQKSPNLTQNVQTPLDSTKSNQIPDSSVQNDQAEQSTWQQIFNLLKEDQQKDSCLSSILLLNNQEHHQQTWNILKNPRSDEISDDLTQDSKTAQLSSQNVKDSENLTQKDNPNHKSSSSIQNQRIAQKSAQLIRTLSQDDENVQKFPSIQFTGSNIPGLTESYNEILPVITTNVQQLKKCAIAIYSWEVEDPNLKPQILKLVDLLSIELRKHHKQLLADISKELRDECDIIRRSQGVAKRKGKEFSQQRNSFILTSRAIIPFLEKRQIYDNLHCMLIYIRDGNRIALELFLDVTEGMEDVFKVDSNARNSFVTLCVKVMDQAAKLKNLDEGTVQRTSKMLEFFKNLKIKPESFQSSETSSIQGSCASLVNESYVSPWPDKQRRRRQRGRRSRDSSQSTQKSGMSGISSRSTGKSSLNVQSIGKSSQNVQSSGKSSQSALSSGKPSQSALSSGKSSQNVQSSGKSSQNVQSSGKSSQSVQSSGKSSQSVQSAVKSNPVPSNVIIDPPVNFKTDPKIMFYINQLQSSNVKQLAPKIDSFLAKDFSRRRLMEILIQKGISDEKFINPVIDLFKLLFENNGIGQMKLIMADEIGNEFINLCQDGGKLEQKLMNLVKFTIEFDPFLQGSFLVKLWHQLLDFVEHDCPMSLKVLVLLMSDKVDILFETRERKRFMRYVEVVLKRKLNGQKDKGLKDKMVKIIRKLEKGEATTKNQSPKIDQKVSNPQTNISDKAKSPENIAKLLKVDDKATVMQEVKTSTKLQNSQPKIQSIENSQVKLTKGLTTDLRFSSFSITQPKSPEKSPQKVQTTPQKMQSPNNENFIQVHPDDKVRPLNFTPDYFLFDNSVTNSQKFERILKSLCEKCNGLENNEENSIKIKEFIAVAIIKVNFLKIQAKTDEIMKFSEIFFELYTSKNQTKFMQWVLMKFLKAWKLYDRNNHYVSPSNRTKIYDRYSKSVLRVKKSFQISNTTLLKNDSKVKSDDITSKSDNITSKSENYQICSDIVHKPEDIASTSGVKMTKAKSMTSKSRTITLRFDDLVPRSEKTVNSVTIPKPKDVNMKFDDITSKSGDVTSKSVITSKSDITSKSCDVTSKLNTTSKPGDLTIKSGDITSKPGDLTSKSVITSKLDSITSKSVSKEFFNSFITNLQTLILNHLTDTTVDVDRDPFYDYFSLEKKKAYEIVCDLYFQDIISTNFVTNSILKMFEYPLIIDKNIDVVVRIMKLVDKLTRIRNNDKNFLEVLQTLWLRLPFGVELMFPVSVDKWTKLKNFIQKSLLYRLNGKEFRALIESFWSELMENPEKFSDIVEIFEDFLEVFGDCFACLIMDFMENRRISLEKFPAENVSKAISVKYKTSILFAFELFEMGMLNCESFSKWLNDDVCLKLVQEHNYEILMKFEQKGLKIDENLDDKLKTYYKKLNIIG